LRTFICLLFYWFIQLLSFHSSLRARFYCILFQLKTIILFQATSIFEKKGCAYVDLVESNHFWRPIVVSYLRREWDSIPDCQLQNRHRNPKWNRDYFIQDGERRSNLGATREGAIIHTSWSYVRYTSCCVMGKEYEHRANRFLESWTNKWRKRNEGHTHNTWRRGPAQVHR